MANEVVVVGGFGSSPERMRAVADPLHGVGINFRNASQHQEVLADLIMDGRVVTHSGGLLPVLRACDTYDVRPEQLTAIASPVQESVHALLAKGAMIGIGLRDDIVSEFEDKIDDSHELRDHAYANFRHVPALSQFNAFAETSVFAEQGTSVTMAMMTRDGMFDLRSDKVAHDVAHARKRGVQVVAVAGGHCRFTHQPAQVMQEIKQAVPFEPHNERIYNNYSIKDYLRSQFSELHVRQLGRLARQTHSV